MLSFTITEQRRQRLKKTYIPEDAESYVFPRGEATHDYFQVERGRILYRWGKDKPATHLAVFNVNT